MKKKVLYGFAGLVLIAALLLILRGCLYRRKNLNFVYDGAYYWSNNSKQFSNWYYENSASGHQYYLYLPQKYIHDKDNEEAKLPLIVVFHGSDEKGLAYSKYGRIFVSEKFQSRIYPEGAAVLVINSRINYFTDPHGTGLLIQNVCFRNKCIDRKNIIGYGFSQGAKFVVELCCEWPGLFRGVVSGSGFYQMNFREIIRALPVCFYWATSEDDKGIFEQGSSTGKRLARFCKNSRYVQYQTRHHFYVELQDKTGRKNRDGSDETFLDWICEVVK